MFKGDLELNGKYTLNVKNGEFNVTNEKGQEIYAEDENGNWVKITYEQDGQSRKIEYSDGCFSKFEHDRLNNVTYFLNNNYAWCTGVGKNSTTASIVELIETSMFNIKTNKNYIITGNRGKTTTLDIIERLVGSENVVKSDISNLELPFVNSSFENKRVIMFDNVLQSEIEKIIRPEVLNNFGHGKTKIFALNELPKQNLELFKVINLDNQDKRRC